MNKYSVAMLLLLIVGNIKVLTVALVPRPARALRE